MCSQWSSKQRIRLNLPISACYPHFSVLSPISAFYPYFSVLSLFQRFIPISAFYPHFSVLSPFQRFIRFRDSVLSLPVFRRGCRDTFIVMCFLLILIGWSYFAKTEIIFIEVVFRQYIYSRLESDFEKGSLSLATTEWIAESTTEKIKKAGSNF
jgi:hypothetical protein